jgi:hypothetical protein
MAKKNLSDKVLNSNDLQRGYEEGKQMATDGKDKSYVGMGMSWKYWLHGKNALNSYTEGYDLGYLDGLREKYQTSNVKIVNSMEKSHGVDEGKNLERLDEGQKRMEKYEKSVRDNLYSTLSSNNQSNFGMNTTYEQQIEIWEKLKQTLETLKEDLETSCSIYFKTVSELEGEGAILNEIVAYQEQLQETHTQLLRVIESLEVKDIPFTTRNIAQYTELLSISKSGGY